MTTQTMFTADDVLAVLQQVVAEKPADYVNPGATDGSGCRYTEQNGTPSCIAGTVLAVMAPGLRPGWDDEDNYSTIPEMQLSGFTQEAIVLLAEAQGVADGGHTWAESLRRATQ